MEAGDVPADRGRQEALCQAGPAISGRITRGRGRGPHLIFAVGRRSHRGGRETAGPEESSIARRKVDRASTCHLVHGSRGEALATYSPGASLRGCAFGCRPINLSGQVAYAIVDWRAREPQSNTSGKEKAWSYDRESGFS